MEFQTPLIEARLIRRYKRFLADMELADGRVVVAHCPNPGAMTGMADPGAKCWLEPNDDPRRKLRWGWRLVAQGEGYAVVDTGLANRVVGEALRAGFVPGLAGLGPLRAEVAYGAGSRVDFRLGADVYVEVKSVTLARGGWAEFPDSVTLRGRKHLGDLTRVVTEGGRAVLLFLVARDDCHRVRVAGDIDPAYAKAFDAARAAGVEIMALGTRISPLGIWASEKLEVDPLPQVWPSGASLTI
jgi:sugar fermentation stimulation protein A